MFSGFHLRQFQHNPRNIPRTQKHQLFMIRKSFSYLDSGYLSGMLCLGYVINRVCWNFLRCQRRQRLCFFRGFTLLHLSAATSNGESTQFLLEQGLNINQQGASPPKWGETSSTQNSTYPLRSQGVKDRVSSKATNLDFFINIIFFLVEQTLLGGEQGQTLQFRVGFWDGYVFLFEKMY